MTSYGYVFFAIITAEVKTGMWFLKLSMAAENILVISFYMAVSEK